MYLKNTAIKNKFLACAISFRHDGSNAVQEKNTDIKNKFLVCAVSFRHDGSNAVQE